jgi:signal transduction histidine kinase
MKGYRMFLRLHPGLIGVTVALFVVALVVAAAVDDPAVPTGLGRALFWGHWRGVLLGLVVGAFPLLIFLSRRLELSLRQSAAVEAQSVRIAAAHLADVEEVHDANRLVTVGKLAAMAHELGTPLGIISGRAEQLLSRLPEGDAGAAERKALDSILAQVDKVGTTIRQLLDFARARPVDAESVTPLQAAESASALLAHRFRAAGVELRIDVLPDVPPVLADRGQLEQVLVNLLINACDACATGGHVSLRAVRKEDSVCFEVIDDGAGISPAHLPQVLDPFFTTKKRGQGTGLGLSIAQDIVKNHGGAIAIESALGRGTTVLVTLPLALEAPDADKKGASE